MHQEKHALLGVRGDKSLNLKQSVNEHIVQLSSWQLPSTDLDSRAFQESMAVPLQWSFYFVALA
jgi:hypothetical protein